VGVGGRCDAACNVGAAGGGVTIPTPTPTVVVDCCPLLTALSSDGPARPLGYLRAGTPTRGEPAGPSTPGPP